MTVVSCSVASSGSELVRSATMVRRCAMCHDQCFFATSEAVVSGRQALATSRKALAILRVLSGSLSWDEVVDVVYGALNSGVQHSFCVYRGTGDSWPDESIFVREARRAIVLEGREPQYVRAVRDLFRNTGSPLGDSNRQRTTSDRRGQGEIVLFLDAPTRAWFPDLAPGLVRLVEALASEVPSSGSRQGAASRPVRVVQEGSSGFELWDLGYWEDARTAMSRLCEAVSGAEVVLSDSPEAVWMLQHAKEQLGIDGLPPARHLVEWVAQRLDIGYLPSEAWGKAPPHEGRVTFQDAAYMGRYGGVYEPPRKLIRALFGDRLVEMAWAREYALPTGPFLGYPSAELAREIAARRLEQAVDAGASAVVTASPYDWRNLTEAARSSAATRGVAVLYLPALLAASRASAGRATPTQQLGA